VPKDRPGRRPGYRPGQDSPGPRKGESGLEQNRTGQGRPHNLDSFCGVSWTLPHKASPSLNLWAYGCSHGGPFNLDVIVLVCFHNQDPPSRVCESRVGPSIMTAFL